MSKIVVITRSQSWQGFWTHICYNTDNSIFNYKRLLCLRRSLSPEVGACLYINMDNSMIRTTPPKTQQQQQQQQQLRH